MGQLLFCPDGVSFNGCFETIVSGSEHGVEDSSFHVHHHQKVNLGYSRQ
jgi:hypothetical protein